MPRAHVPWCHARKASSALSHVALPASSAAPPQVDGVIMHTSQRRQRSDDPQGAHRSWSAVTEGAAKALLPAQQWGSTLVWRQGHQRKHDGLRNAAGFLQPTHSSRAKRAMHSSADALPSAADEPISEAVSQRKQCGKHSRPSSAAAVHSKQHAACAAENVITYWTISADTACRHQHA